MVFTDRYRFLSPGRIFLGAVLVCAVLLLSVGDEINAAAINWTDENKSSICDCMYRAMVFDRYKSLLVIILSAFVAPSYAKDASTHFLRMELQRCSILSWSVSRLLISAVYVQIIMLSGTVLAAMVLSPFMVLESKTPVRYGSYEGLVSGEGTWLYLLLMAEVFSLSALPACNLGMVVSVWKPNTYIAIGSSFFFFYIAYAVTGLLPDLFNYSYLSSAPRDGLLLLYQCSLFAGLILLTANLFYRTLNRRRREGFV